MSYNSPGCLALVSEGPQGRPAVLETPARLRVLRGSTTLPGDSRSGAMFCSVHQQARATRAHVPGPTGSTRYPGLPGPGFQCSWGRPALPGNSGQCPSSRKIDQLYQATRAHILIPAGTTSCPRRVGQGCVFPRGRPAVPDDLRPGPWARVRGPAVHHLYRAIRAHARCPAGSTSCPG